jgi:endo-1,4-beta-xylanase
MHWENYATTWYAVITNVNNPAILLFLPTPGTAPRSAVVVCPGGGHAFLAMEHEGYAVGKWLADHGVVAVVLEYRLARAPGSTYRVGVHALMDAQRAIRTIRSCAKEWNVNPASVGIMGFSAGGEVAALAATQFDRPVPGTNDAIDAFSCRPDFQALFYPGMPTPGPQPTAQTPPAFLCGGFADTFQLTPPLVRYYLRLSDAGVPTELHVFAYAGHGFGIRDADDPVYSWMGLFHAWLDTLGRQAAASTGTAAR